MSLERPRFFLHVDLDAFFASVEQLDHPEYRGKPLIVGGLPGDRRSVVSTASYEARKFGVHSAMPTARAFQLCPQGIFVRGRMDRYQEKSHQVMEILSSFSPDVVQISVDEAFLDLTGTERLMGKPVDIAHKLKKQVKEQTGLTISVGIAPTMYLAKIASGLHKPDGLTVVAPGEEESFMLDLPLEKVWGVGTKTLEHLERAGFTSTRSIHTKSENLLKSIFGENTGSFLYNAVRGNKGLSFGDEAKNHSISSEPPFDFYLTERYTLYTALLKLSHTVMFRLHRGKLHSRTVSLKIRYEDFTTVSIQETSETCFQTVDDLYERCTRLFSKKYESGRGIRLLGVAAQNVEDGTVPVQNDLFDFGSKKKAAVEKSIVSFEDKHPGIKITKARTLSKNMSVAILSAFILLCTSTKSISAETDAASESSGAGAIVFSSTVPLLPDVSSDESPVSLFNYSTDNANVSFLAQGFWQSEVSGTRSSTFGYGNPFAISFGTPVFTQNVDLTLWFMLNKSWYFESSFADSFSKNTVAAGYIGTGVLKNARIANRGIVFPSYYSATKAGRSIGGGDNTAPGVMFHLEDGVWKADVTLLYDMVSRKSKLFYGKHSVTTTSISPSAYTTGRQFVLPSADLVSAVASVYVESSGGMYTDSNGRTYKKLSASDYLLVPADKMIVLSAGAGASKKNTNQLPAVMVTFDSSDAVTKLNTELGSYGTASSPGAAGTFLGDLQRYFGSASKEKPNLASYAYKLFTTIGGETALYLQYPVGFSPFAMSSRYCGGTLTDADALVVRTSTSLADSTYSVVETEDSSLVSNDFFSSKQLWLTVTDTESDNASYSDPSVRFPFASYNPAVYLAYSQTTNLTIELQTYTDVTSFSIGKKIINS